MFVYLYINYICIYEVNFQITKMNANFNFTKINASFQYVTSYLKICKIKARSLFIYLIYLNYSNISLRSFIQVK